MPALTLSRLAVLPCSFITVVDATLGFPVTVEAPGGRRDAALTAAALAGRRGASAPFAATAFSLTDRVIGRPTVPGAVEGLDIPTRVVLVLVVAVPLVVEPLTDAAELVRLMVFRVIIDRGAVALVVVVRLGKALARWKGSSTLSERFFNVGKRSQFGLKSDIVWKVEVKRWLVW